MKIRSSGILLHLSSLPSQFGIGDMGPSAYEFADFLTSAGQRYWQLLPLNPTGPSSGYSPYHSTSAFAFNPLLISPEFLVRDGLLSKADVKKSPGFPKGRADYARASNFKSRLLNRAFDCFQRSGAHSGFDEFCSENADWLDDFSLFVALKARFPGGTWNEWGKGLRDRSARVLQNVLGSVSESLERTKFFQYICSRQWSDLKSYCNGRSVQIIGDMPLYVQYDSADLWTHGRYFKLDRFGRPEKVAGVPPDYFSKTGQLWGNPLYDWDRMRKSGYEWWLRRIGHNLQLFDFLRIDHFRGLVSYWEVPAKDGNAINGKWTEAPAGEFLQTVLKKFPHAPFIAEDLGMITPDVKEMVERFQLPGMRVLMFAFGKDHPSSIHALHNHVKNCVVYTGTHDNNTARGWFEAEAPVASRKILSRYLGRKVTSAAVSDELIRLAMMSVANTVIIPMQDLLGLGEECRMNLPSRKKGNWKWRLLPGQLNRKLSKRLLGLCQVYGRN